MSNIYVIRHGEVDFNVNNKINGVNNCSLNATGIEQAKSRSSEVKEFNIDLIICSPLQRAKETCKYVNVENKPVEYDNRLMERDSRSMQYKSVDILDMNIWYDAQKEIIYEDAEGFRSVLKRVYEFLDEIKEKHLNKNILLVTHGDVCKAIYMYFNKNEVTDISKIEQKNCEIFKYKF